jgi:hypothetical protein
MQSHHDERSSVGNFLKHYGLLDSSDPAKRNDFACKVIFAREEGAPACGFPGVRFPARGFPARGFPARGFPARGFPGAWFSGARFSGRVTRVRCPAL